MFTIHATRKLLDRVKQPVTDPAVAPTTALGNWYATALFWQPQVALLVNETTLIPVLMPLAPASTLIHRFPEALGTTLRAHGIDQAFIDRELAAMSEGRYAKTASRSVVGVMNEWAYFSNAYRGDRRADDLVTLALEVSQVPCGPLRNRHGSADRELQATIASIHEETAF